MSESFSDIAKIMLMSQLCAPAIVLNPPTFARLKVTSVKRFPRELTTDYFGWTSLEEPEELPARMLVRGTVGSDRPTKFVISVNLEERVIEHATWNALARSSDGGSGELGVVLFGIPSLIVTSPVLFTWWLARRALRTCTGMSVHTWSVWMRIRGQLDDDDARELHSALINHGNGVEVAHLDGLRKQHRERMRQEELARSFESRKDSITDGPLMLRLEHGCAEPEDALDAVRDWERRLEHDRHVQLHEWLGMSEQELNDWRAGRRTVMDLLEERERSKRGSVHHVSYGQPGVEVASTSAQSVDARHAGRMMTAALEANARSRSGEGSDDR